MVRDDPDLPDLPPDWAEALRPELAGGALPTLRRFLRAERKAGHVVFPPAPLRLAAFAHTRPDSVRVVILGQDPYHGPGQAHGLAFSVPAGLKRPPSLRNIMRELHTDLDLPESPHGCLDGWAQSGVLLLNSALTVRAALPGSHAAAGWDALTRAVLRAVSKRPAPSVFILWGAQAGRYADEVDAARHLVIRSAHPSPLSARTGFFGSRPFSRTDAFLAAQGRQPVDWRLVPC